MTSSVVCSLARLEFDREITAIRFGNEHAEFRAEPARIAFHIGIAAQDFFRFVQHARSFLQAGARWRPIIDDEAALIETRQKVRLAIGDNTKMPTTKISAQPSSVSQQWRIATRRTRS